MILLLLLSALAVSGADFGYVTISNQNVIAKIDPRTNTIAAYISLSGSSYDIAAKPDGSKIYASVFSGTLDVVDTATNTRQSVSVGVGARSLAVSPDGAKIYLTNVSTNVSTNTLSVISTATNSVLTSIALDSVPSSVAISPDGAQVYVTNEGSNTLSVISAGTTAIESTIAINSPRAVVFSPDGTRAYVSNYGSDTVTVLDTATNSIVTTISVGDGPWAIAVSPDAATVYIGNYLGGSISVIDAATNTVRATTTGNLVAITSLSVSPDGTKLYVGKSQTILVLSVTSNNVLLGISIGLGNNPASIVFANTVPVPTIKNISPTSGPLQGGQSIAIRGTNFVEPMTVMVGGKPADYVQVLDSTRMTATTPSGDSGKVSVTAANGFGSTPVAVSYTYQDAPTVTSITPSSGPDRGGQLVTITGTNLIGAGSVTLGGVAATKVWVTNSTTMTAVTPPGVAGAVSVIVTTPSGANAGNSLYTYEAAIPIVTSISPSIGPLSGGQAVTITGDNFTGATSVTIGGVAATNLQVLNQNTITATTPPGGAGPASLLVTTPIGMNSANSVYTYQASPIISSVSPAFGPSAGGQLITISGANMMGATGVTIGGVNAPQVTNISPTTLTVVTPVGVAGTVASVQVITPAGTNNTNGLYTYWPQSKVYAYVASGNDAISVVNAQTTSVEATIGPVSSPDRVAVTPDGKKLYATSAGTNALYVVDTQTNLVMKTLDLGSNGVKVLISADAAKVYVLLANINRVVILDSSTDSVVARIAIGVGAFDFALSLDGRRLYVTNQSSNTVTVIDTQIASAVATVPVGAMPRGVVVSPDGDRVFVANSSDASVSVISAAMNAVVATIPVGSNPSALLLSPDGARLYVFHDYGAISIVDPFKMIKSAGFTLGTTGYNPLPVITADGAKIYVAFAGSSELGIITTATNSATRLNVGLVGTTLRDLKIAPDEASIHALLSNASLAVISPRTDRVVSSIAVPYSLTLAITNRVPVPIVSNITPRTGRLEGGQIVTITGRNFVAGGTRVTLGGVDATNVIVVSPASIIATTPAKAAGKAEVVVATASGQSISGIAYNYVDVPIVTSVSNSSGLPVGGQLVTITGSNFVERATNVSFGGAAATDLVFVDSTSVRVKTPAGVAGPASVQVTTPSGTSSANALYTYQDIPTVTSVSPNAGPLAGGQLVTIKGTNFMSAVSVSIGVRRAASFNVLDSTTISATTLAGNAGPAQVFVTTGSGTNALNTLYTFQSSPIVTSISPSSGPTAGGQLVTITGANFIGSTEVTIGGVPVTNITVVSSTSITATTPAGSVGTASVLVTTPSGTNADNTLYSYIAAPTVSSISPSSGPTTGGQSVTITGTGFTGATGVTIGGTAATGVRVVNSTSITLMTPAGTAGTASVLVTTPYGTNAANTLYGYVAAPTAIAISPSSGPAVGGQSVTITGSGFTGATAVTIGGTAATNVTVVSATSITATTPAGLAGAASVLVTTPYGTNVANTLYSYVAAPTVSSISPSNGPTAGGQSITITGTGFTGATSVTIGGGAVTDLTVVSPTSITATTPAGTAGTASVLVTTPYGTNAANTLYSYNAVLQTTVPNVVGMTQAQAVSALTTAGLSVRNITTAATQSVAPGLVISSNPVAGTVVSPGSAVDLVISGPVVTNSGPSSGTGTTQTFVFTFNQSGGYTNLNVLNVLINNAVDGRQACYLAYVVAANTLYLVNDAGDGGGPFAGGMLLNGSGSVSNSQCTIQGSGSSALGSGNTLTLTLKATFTSGFSGNKILYTAARDVVGNNTGWQAVGVWGVPGSAPTGPAVGGMNPAQSTATTQTFSFTFTSTNGWQDISVANVLINSAIDGRNACYVALVPLSATSGSVYLVDDVGNAGGPYSGISLPGSGTASNSQCSIAANGSSFSGSGNTLTVTLAVTFGQNFTGNRIAYLAARNVVYVNSGWQAAGTVSR